MPGGIEPALLVVGAYLAGSIPTGVVLARLARKTDPRTVGSGNIGATNVARTMGAGMGIATLAGDALKGALPAALASWWMGPGLAAGLVAVAAVVGHCFPVFLGFRGGKGVATGLGVFAVLAPLATLASTVVFVAVAVATRIVSLGSIAASAALPLVAALVPRSRPFAWAAAAAAALILVRHRGNVARLLRGEEPRFSTRRRDRPPQGGGAGC